MSNYHVLAADEAANTYTIVFHVPVPDTLNTASVSYRTALIQYLGGSQTSSVPFIDSGEQTQLDAGELYETSRQYYSNPAENLATKQAALDAMYAQVVSEVQADFQDRLGYWGYSRDVP